MSKTIIQEEKSAALAKWHDIYNPINNAFFTPQADPYTDPKHVVIHQMVVDMEEVYIQLRKKSPEWVTLTILADVIIFPAPSADNNEFSVGLLDQNEAITLLAREIDVIGSKALIGSYGAEGTLTVYAQTINGKLDFDYLELSDEEAQSTAVSTAVSIPEGDLGVQIQAQDLQPKPLTKVNIDLSEDGQLYWLLESSYNCAAALSYQNSGLAKKLLSWIKTISLQGTATQYLALQSTQLSLQVDQFASKTNYVPRLQADVYEALNDDYLKSVQAYENDFNRFAQTLAEKKDVTGYSKSMLGYFTDKTGESDTLIAQTKQNLQTARDNFAKDKAQFQHQLTDVVIPAKHVFQTGIETFKEKKKTEAIMQAVSAGIQIVASAAEMAVGDEAGAGQAAQGVEQAASAGMKLLELMKKIAKVIKALNTLFEDINKAQEAIEKIENAQELEGKDFGQNLTLPTGNDVYNNTYWDTFKNEIQHSLRPYTPTYAKDDNVVDGADKFLQSLEDMSSFGKANYADKLKIVQYQQQLLKLTLDQKANKGMRDRLQKLVADSKKDSAALERAKLVFYRKLLDIKGRLLLSLNDQLASWKYWALKESLPVEAFSLTDTIGDLYAKLGVIEKKRIQAIDDFYPGPRDFDVPIRINKNSHPQQFNDFRTKRSFILVIPLSEKAFTGFGRIRLDDFHVYLNEEAVPEAEVTVKLQVATLATYEDRNQDNETFLFAGSPYTGHFQYQRAQEKPVGDMNVAQSFDKDYFKPTPFTTWIISLDPNNEATIDFDALNTITLHFMGSRIDLN